MTAEQQCKAVANLRGEHIPCDSAVHHTAHGNREHGLIWSCGSREIDADVATALRALISAVVSTSETRGL